MNTNTRLIFFFFFVLVQASLFTFEKANAQIDSPRFSPDITRLAPVGVLVDTVNVWGAVSQRGRFVVPRGTTVSEILSFTGGPNLSSRGGGTNIFGFYLFPQVDVYLNRFDVVENKEYTVRWTYRVKDPFPVGMRNYQLQNGEYITVNIRTRPTTLQYVLFGISTIGSFVGFYFLMDRIL